MLNITTIILEFTLLPLRFAILRTVAGILLPTVVTYVVARVVERWQKPALIVPMDRDRAVRWVDRYMQLFNVDALIENRRLDKPGSILTAWWRASGKLALILLPTLFLWSVITSAIVQLLPPAFGNNFFSVVLAAIGGTILMISTWTEIPVALQLIHSGFTGPAATVLVVLPPLSLPCVMLLGGALRRFGSVVLLALAVMISGIAAGIIFL